MFGKEIQAAMEPLLEALQRVSGNLEALRTELVRGRQPDLITGRPFMRYRSNLVQDGTGISSTASVDQITITPPKGHSGIVTRIATESPNFAPAGLASGIVFSVLVGESPFFDLANMNGPFGTIGHGTPVSIPFASTAPFILRARNIASSTELSACSQVWGFWYTVAEGTGLRMRG